MGNRRVLIVGSGGREHALAVRLLESPEVADVVVAPGNGGMHRLGIRSSSLPPREAARSLAPDLIVVGPEQPLCEGLVDELSAEGFRVFGPSQKAARLEGSKAFMKRFADEFAIATGDYEVVDAEDQLGPALARFDSPPVVKADGLCAGKGVVVARSFEEARAAATAMLDGSAFGEAGRVVVLEERLAGSELSVHAICDGHRAWILPLVQDHKQLLDGGKGPNTGGMGTYGPVSAPTAGLEAQIRRDIVDKILQGMAARGTPFVGTLFAGLMLVQGSEPKLLEINTRFGDPETQILMNVVPGDLYRVLAGAAEGKLDPPARDFEGCGRHALCVVVAAPGYPSKPKTGSIVEGLEAAAAGPVAIYHAGTRLVEGRTITSGGRVLGITGVGSDLPQARRAAYEAVAKLSFPGMQYRTDIGREALDGERFRRAQATARRAGSTQPRPKLRARGRMI